MRGWLLLISLSVFVFAAACGTKHKSEVFMTFNEGVTLSTKATEEAAKGDQHAADSLNTLAISKFKETMRLDSLHPAVRSALAHSYYRGRSYREAVEWFGRANKFGGEVAAGYRELGLSQLNLGMMQAGKLSIDTALLLDTSVAMRKIAVDEITSIANHAWAHGEAYKKQGEQQKSDEYCKMSVSVSMLAFAYDSLNKNLAGVIADRASQIGDSATWKKYLAWPVR